jgi:hypothetical protein
MNAPRSAYHFVCLQVRSLDSLSPLKCVLSNYLYPISIRVQGKGNMFHPAISQLLLEFVPRILDSLAGSLEIVHTDTCMSKTSIGLRIPSRNLIVGIVLGSVIVCQLDEAFAIAEVVGVGDCLGTVVTHEIEVKLGFRLFNLSNHLHTEVFVELDCQLLDK